MWRLRRRLRQRLRPGVAASGVTSSGPAQTRPAAPFPRNIHQIQRRTGRVARYDSGMARPGEVSWPGGEEPVRPVPAPVVPRVRAAGAGPDAAALPLHARVGPMLGAAGVRGVVAVTGPPGSGKTVALEHLASVLLADSRLHRVHLVDGGPFEWAEAVGRAGLVVYACDAVPRSPLLAAFEMAPWSRDDCLEYLL